LINKSLQKKVGLMNQAPTRINQSFTALFGLGLLNQLPTLKKVSLMDQALAILTWI
jgi:hypothetical protein